MKINEPMGRLGSWSPERARRTAWATAAMASDWPTTRPARRSSMRTNLSRSPSSILATGMPVQRDTTSAMSSSSTSSLSILRSFWSSANCPRTASMRPLSSVSRP